MVNPFDRNFFHFFVGFLVILCTSFSILFLADKYSRVLDGKAAAITAVGQESVR
jgi:hypothetical protein